MRTDNNAWERLKNFTTLLQSTSWREVYSASLRFICSVETIFALRSAVSTAALSSLVFVSALRGFVVCYIALFIFFAQSVISAYPYIGSVVRGALSIIVAGLISGSSALICLAASAGNAIALYFLFNIFTLLIALLRLEPELTPLGIFSNLLFSLQILVSIKIPFGKVWKAVYPTWISVCLAAAAAFLASIVFYPLSARKELRVRVRKVLENTSSVLSMLERYIWDSERDTSIIAKIAYFCRTLAGYIPFEPRIWPPWKAEPVEEWHKLIDHVDMLLVNLEALAGVIRRGYGVTPATFQKIYGSHANRFREHFETINEEVKTLAAEVDCGEKQSSKLNFDLRDEIARESLLTLRRFWRNEKIFDRDSFPEAFEAVALLSFSLGLRSIQKAIEKVQTGICNLEIKRTELNFAPLRNWFSWFNSLFAPFLKLKAMFVLLRNTSNLKFLVKHTIAIAVMAFPIIFIAEFSETEENLLKKYNSITAIIMAIIMFMRGIELTVFRIVLYCLSTVASSALAYAATVFAGHNPYVLSVWLGFWTFLASLMAVYYPAYLVASLAFIFSEYFIICCQYWLPSFTFVYAASRTISIFVGCCVTALISFLLWPYRSADEVRKILTDVALKENEMFRKAVIFFMDTNKQGRTTAYELNERENQIMNEIKVALGRVKAALRADPSLSFAHESLPNMLESLSSIHRRLVYIFAVSTSKPALTGSFSNSIWHAYLRHLETDVINVLDAVDGGFKSVIEQFRLHRKDRPPSAQIMIAKENFFQCRKILLMKYQYLRQAIIQKWRKKVWKFASSHTGEDWKFITTEEEEKATHSSVFFEEFINGPPELKPDDNVRYLSWLYSILVFFESFDSFLQNGLKLKNAAGVNPYYRVGETSESMSISQIAADNESFARLSSLPSFREASSGLDDQERSYSFVSKSFSFGERLDTETRLDSRTDNYKM
eukprot:jgi/Galph1/6117/GphlegSOOS_G4719.1